MRRTRIYLFLGLLLPGSTHADGAGDSRLGTGGGGKGEGCIGIRMPCQFGPQSDTRCAARARLPHVPSPPDGVCTLTELSAPGLSPEAREWLRTRLREEVLPAVRACYEEGLSHRPSLRGHLVLRVSMKDGCAEPQLSGPTALPDRFTLECIRERFVGFSAAPVLKDLLSWASPATASPFTAQLKDRAFRVRIELRPAP